MRRLLLILLFAAPLSAETVRYQVRPVYSNIGFSIVKWGVLKEEGQFRDFNGTLDYDPSNPRQARIDVVAQAASLDTSSHTAFAICRRSESSPDSKPTSRSTAATSASSVRVGARCREC